MKLAEQIELACVMEATARKPGNVHPAAAFDDLCYDDFVRAAKAIAIPLSRARRAILGRVIFNAVQATRTATGTNVNLGIILLLAPLAAVPGHVPLEAGLPRILECTTIDDAEQVYAAIRLAQPGGMGDVPAQDIRQPPTVTLRAAMALAADRDRIAEQYVTHFRIVFEAREKLDELLRSSSEWEAAVVALHMWMLSRWPDTLIARKCGSAVAAQAMRRAAVLIDSMDLSGRFDRGKLAEFDTWLREDGHRRNPGTTADLIAATLFAASRDRLIELPTRDEIDRLAVRIRAGQT